MCLFIILGKPTEQSSPPKPGKPGNPIPGANSFSELHDQFQTGAASTFALSTLLFAVLSLAMFI